MKKIVSIFMILAMMLSFAAVSTSAAEGMFIDQGFNTMEEFTQDFAAGAFYTNNQGLLYGYAEARALQSIGNHTWNTYDMEVNLAFADDEMSDVSRNILLSYPNTNLEIYGRFEGTCYMNFVYDFEEDELVLAVGGGADYNEDDTVLAGPLSIELKDDGATFYKLGMSVDKNRIRCFLDGELIFDYVDTANDWMIAYETNEPFLLWNTGNFIQVDHVAISSPGYLFPYEIYTEDTDISATDTLAPDESDTPADDTTPADDKNDVPADDKADAPAEDDKADAPADNGAEDNAADDEPSNAPGNADSNTPADTNQNKPAGGTSATTGDPAFVVVAAMVAALGCALIVRKVNVK